MQAPPHPPTSPARLLEQLYADLWITPIPAIGGFTCAIGVIDDHSRWVWVAGLKRKSDAQQVIAEFIPREERRTGNKIIQFDTDNGGEFQACKQLFATLGINHHFATAYAHHEMGEIEWFWRRSLDSVRAWLIRSELPLWLWLEGLVAATFVRNRLGTKVLGGKSPFEVKYGAAPDLSRLVAWGSLAYTLIAPEIQGNKLSHRARRCFVVGYDEHSKALRFYDPSRRMVFKSYHFKIFEGVYHRTADPAELVAVKEWLREADAATGGERFLRTTIPGHPYFRADMDPNSRVGGGSANSAPPTVRPLLVSPTPTIVDDASIPRSANLREQRYPLRERVQRTFVVGKEIAPPPPPPVTVPIFDTPARHDPSPEPSETDLALLARERFGAILDAAEYDPELELDPTAVAYKVWSNNPDEPSYRAAVNGPDRDKWDPAISGEKKSLRAMGCFDEELIDLPPGAKAIPLEFVLLIKRDAGGTITKYKARLVARGDLQSPDSYGETFAPTLKMASFRMMLALLAQNSGKNRRTSGPAWTSGQFDVSSAYLHGELAEVVYVKQIPGEDDGTGRVRRLRKTLYGLKQSGHEWNNVLHAALVELGFARLAADGGVYYRERQGLEILLGIHVDDGAMVGNDDIPEVVRELNKRFVTKDLGPLKEFLAMEVVHDAEAGTVDLHQRGYARRILERTGMEACNGVTLQHLCHVT
ncbi:hypothetical protein RQP46_007901 [Phenoliferia psychrophenolica]